MAVENSSNKQAVSGNDPMLDALIIGAGFSGLYQLHLLRNKSGLSARVLEAGSGVGGAWFWNRYPGARCDSESHAYCYSFSAELTQDWDWSERYPGSAEIRSYLNHVADRFDLRRDIQFDTTVVSAHFIDADNYWQVTTKSGDQFSARYLITAVGCLSTANIPKIPGLETFAGQWHHTGEWPTEGVDFSGKRVGQIGTGSTGIQAVPVIAETAKHLTVFQRTANYSVPARNAALGDEQRQQLKDNASQTRAVMKSNTNGHPWKIDPLRAVDIPDPERESLYQDKWDEGGLRFRSAFSDLLTSKDANDTAVRFLTQKIRDTVSNPQTAAVLSDIDHPYGAKRPPIDTHYFETYNQGHVELVDLRNDPIQRITETGIVTEQLEHPLDVIVFATGYDAFTGTLLRMDIRGTDGQKLTDCWASGPYNYLGLQVAGFPNLFTVTGPGSPSVLTNMPVAIEQHVEWISDCINHLEKNGMQRIEASPEAMAGWTQEVNDAANATLLPTVKHSWYLGANVPGKPQIFMPYAGGMARYRDICASVAERNYDGFELR